MERVRNNEEEEEEDVAMSGQQKGGGCNYGDALYWDARYLEEGGAAFDWYQRYAALRPFVRKFVQTSSRVLMVGCGSALMSEDMIKDGYAEIMNIDISAIVIEMMKRKYAVVRQLKYMQMDVRDMSFFSDESFDCVIDKGTLDSLMCGPDAPLSAAQMIQEVNRLLKPGGIFILITYGDPSARVHHMNQEGCCWKIVLYVMPRPGFQVRPGSSSRKSFAEPVPLTEKGQLPAGFIPEDPDSHYIYICRTKSILPLEVCDVCINGKTTCDRAHIPPEEVSIWGSPLRTSGLLSMTFSSRHLTILSGKITDVIQNDILTSLSALTSL